MPTTRLAPSPTGALHLGNARTFLVNWLLARQRGWRVILRIEDLDAGRIKPGTDQQALDDLHWLGLEWDGPPTFQLHRLSIYEQSWQDLLARGLAYPCICTRKEATLAGSAPHAEDGSTIYPGTCRGRFASISDAQAAAGRPPALRFATPDGPIEFIDGFRGRVRYENVRRELGDFVIARPGGAAAYQLAVVVDDSATGVTHVVRGDDLLASTPRQMLIYAALGLARQTPTYFHLPLLVGDDGKRLAKRHGDTRLSSLRAAGVRPQKVLGFLARISGVVDADKIALDELAARFDLEKMKHEPFVIGPADYEWLLRDGN